MMNFWWSVTNVRNWGGDWALDRLAGGRSSFSGLLFPGYARFFGDAPGKTVRQVSSHDATWEGLWSRRGGSGRSRHWLTSYHTIFYLVYFNINYWYHFSYFCQCLGYRSLSQKQFLFKTQALIFVQVLRDSTQAESNQEKPNARVVAIRQRSQREIGGCIYDISDLQVALQNGSCGFEHVDWEFNANQYTQYIRYIQSLEGNHMLPPETNREPIVSWNGPQSLRRGGDSQYTAQMGELGYF